MEWDVFISHASEDKASVARPLTELLKQSGLKVWLDASELTLGDSLSRKIDEGLAQSTYGVVILSKQFFLKRWPPHELAGLAAKQLIGGRKVILPVWHGVDQTFIVHYSPPLADALAADTKDGLEKVAFEIVQVVRSSVPATAAAGAPKTTPRAKRKSIFVVVVGLLLLILISSAALLVRRYPSAHTGPPRATSAESLPNDSVRDQKSISTGVQLGQNADNSGQAPKVLRPEKASPPSSGKKRVYIPAPEDSPTEEQPQESQVPSAAFSINGAPGQTSASPAGAVQQQNPPPTPIAESKLSQPIFLEPITVGPGRVTKEEADRIAFDAQYSAAKILNCLVTSPQSDGKACIAVYGTSVVSVKDELHNRGIEFAQLNDSVRQLESAPSEEGLRRSADVLRAVADKIREIAQQQNKAAPDEDAKAALEEPIPTDVSITLPSEVHIRKGQLRSLSNDASAIAATIDRCVAEREGHTYYTEKQIAGFCLGAYVEGTDSSGSVTEKIRVIRRELATAGVALEGLEDIARRIGRGPSKGELRYFARLDSLSQELSKRAR